MNQGEFNRNTNILNIQPVFPFADGRIITRTIFPIVRNPDFGSENGVMASGLSGGSFPWVQEEVNCSCLEASCP